MNMVFFAGAFKHPRNKKVFNIKTVPANWALSWHAFFQAAIAAVYMHQAIKAAGG